MVSTRPPEHLTACCSVPQLSGTCCLAAPLAVVTNISQTGDSVTVTTANGTQLPADYVIVTAPLGVLKQGSIGFAPPLPADKLQAIKEMVGSATLVACQHCLGLSRAFTQLAVSAVCLDSLGCNGEPTDGSAQLSAHFCRLKQRPLFTCLPCFRHKLPQRLSTNNLPQGMGVLDKVVLVFGSKEDVFWTKTGDFVIMAPDDWSGRW